MQWCTLKRIIRCLFYCVTIYLVGYVLLRIQNETTLSKLTQMKQLTFDICYNNSIAPFLWRVKATRHFYTDEIRSYLDRHCRGHIYANCNNATKGRMEVYKKGITLDTLSQGELNFVKHGGWWSPESCSEVTSTAVIIPFRNRYEHLSVLLRHLHPMLRRQRLHYRIFVIDQDDENTFNRGKLLNVGFSEALKMFPYSCFVFHDVDLIPEDDRISYGCKYSPMHLAVAVDKFNYELIYDETFGGVEMFTSKDYVAVNGFSNIFYTWGGEDDGLWERIRQEGMHVHRHSPMIFRYTMLTHKSREDSRTKRDKSHTLDVYDASTRYRKSDGLSSLQYKVNDITEHRLFTMIKVDLQKDKENKFGLSLL